MSHHSDHEAEHTPEAIRRRLAAESRQGFLKDSIYGAIDGAVTTFAVISSAAGAGLSSGIVVVLGLANLLADGFSMAMGNFSGTRAENQATLKARKEEELEIEEYPEGEREEIRQIFAAKGFEGEVLDEIVAVITADRDRWLDTMMQEEHGQAGPLPAAWKAAGATFIAFLVIGSIPLLPFLIDLGGAGLLGNPFWPACLLTGLAFFAVGAVKGRVVDQHWALGGAETLGIGALAAGMAYAVGALLRPLADGI